MTSDGEGPFQGEAGEAVGVRWESVRQVIRSDQRGALVTVIDGQDVGAKLLVTATATEGSLSDRARAAARRGVGRAGDRRQAALLRRLRAPAEAADRRRGGLRGGARPGRQPDGLPGDR